jgi:hypothetical protein
MIFIVAVKDGIEMSDMENILVLGKGVLSFVKKPDNAVVETKNAEENTIVIHTGSSDSLVEPMTDPAKLACKKCGGQHNYDNCPVVKKEREKQLERERQDLIEKARRKVVNLEWKGYHDSLNAGFDVHLECGHSFWRPTNILACDSIAKDLKEKGAICQDCFSELSKNNA